QKLFHERLSASEKKFRELFEKSPTGILRTFADGRIESANESALKMLGYSHFDIAGKPFQEFIYPNDLEYANTILKNLQLGLLENAEFEARCIHKNKKLFWAKVHITSIYKMNSTIDFFIIQFTDITPLKNALRDLVESKEQFQTVFDDSPLMSTIVDAETSRFIEVNKRFLEVSGFTKEEVIGKTPSEIGWLTEEVRTKVLQEALAQGKILDLELSPTNKYGQTIYMRYNAVIIEIGGKKHLLSLAQDITELKQMTKRRWEAEQNYQKLYNSMQQGIVIQDKNGTILDCNPAAERILGRSRDQLIGDCTYTTEWNSIRENGEPYPIEDHPSQIALRTKQPVLNAIMGIRRLSDNQLIWISIDAIPEFIESDSEPQFVFVTFSDITAEILLLDHQKLTQKRLDATLRLTEYMYKSDEVFLRQVIEEVSTISESEHASLFLREKDDEPFKAIARSESQLQCQLCAKVAYLPLKENVWTKVIDTKRYIIVNDFDFEYPDSLPENHIKLQRALFVPILVENKVLGIVSVANKRLPYTQQDAEHLELFIATVWHMIEKRKAEAKLLETITTSATILDHLPSGFMLFEWDGARELSLVQLNHRTKEMLSISDEQIGKKFLELFSEGEDRGLIDAFIGVMTSGNPLFLNDLFYQDERIGGFFRVVAFPLPKNHLAILFDDITNLKRVEQEKKRLEDTLQQAQKMEAIGQLAGGVAHDFNNILQVIVGYTELAQLKLGISAFPNDEIELIQQAAERAKNLVHQLLTFSRRGEMNLEPHVLSDIVQSTTDLLKRLIGEQIELRLQIEERTPETLVDAGQIELILMNLCVNSRDAMPNGGKITIKVDTVFPSDTMLRQYPWAPVGKYVRISVSDTGTGIPPEILHRIFEPFFTTKSRGKGTGLGLATVYGIVRRHSGFITVNSQVGIGTRFDLYFPIIETIQTETTKKTGTQIKLFEVKGEGRKLLLAEDETDVRYVMKRILEQAGFVVYTASDGEEAMKVAEQYLHDLDAFILDGIMPKANGIEVFRFIRNLKPNAKVIFCTGYDFGTFELDESIYQSATVLQKPVSSDTLLMTVQEVLEP
ncbi:MAG: PAS domain S-box protein, partial [bacterium]|nr:PAS domain S-box protein [bacterium]